MRCYLMLSRRVLRQDFMREHQEVQEHAIRLKQLLELKETELREVLEERDDLYLSTEEANAELGRQQVRKAADTVQCEGILSRLWGLGFEVWVLLGFGVLLSNLTRFFGPIVCAGAHDGSGSRIEEGSLGPQSQEQGAEGGGREPSGLEQMGSLFLCLCLSLSLSLSLFVSPSLSLSVSFYLYLCLSLSLSLPLSLSVCLCLSLSVSLSLSLCPPPPPPPPPIEGRRGGGKGNWLSKGLYCCSFCLRFNSLPDLPGTRVCCCSLLLGGAQGRQHGGRAPPPRARGELL